jgi:hypothetical protein
VAAEALLGLAVGSGVGGRQAQAVLWKGGRLRGDLAEGAVGFETRVLVLAGGADDAAAAVEVAVEGEWFLGGGGAGQFGVAQISGATAARRHGDNNTRLLGCNGYECERVL